MNITGLILLGLTAGFASGCFGVGGGIVIVPALILFFGIPYHVAVGTSLAVIIPIALAGSIFNGWLQKIDWSIVWVILIFGVIGALIGVWSIQKIPANIAKKIFSFFLLYSAYRLWIGSPIKS
ncbi:sulfite exporter TauE/SafE family protein [Candidatus Methylacidiphilum fumarolicum]|uniref:Probable membrane transporter protein n=2 Tax=Candidatus Methylacidiphilum fumarolicum TaxID=591154 RepID=I0JY02_METFB|nr:sulfite exporter TauE/SafE family protein [Candidatus Methylacidiphilum fumarolicum]MBW6414140.1 sulfite exporter TauE/SafE family protein [Candidatus Methylacidiphilum fumarolicum]TFE70022.1 permease [Candidatus Methylacidiphilum fumarolicum]TFE73824.1 sulfite exporter TauE/SafE family protein [Candidatus Methylacidiphilum fumarolicum]TFE75570.1 sulfite exporter TauE/SafE family protein [Candidatus Methylacidiphilum fumarolicum]TFE76732.1 permease [Candidatus Methylacidiphilum fumarolicum]